MDTVDGPTPKLSASISPGDVSITGPLVEFAAPSITVFKNTVRTSSLVGRHVCVYSVRFCVCACACIYYTLVCVT